MGFNKHKFHSAIGAIATDRVAAVQRDQRKPEPQLTLSEDVLNLCIDNKVRVLKVIEARQMVEEFDRTSRVPAGYSAQIVSALRLIFEKHQEPIGEKPEYAHMSLMDRARIICKTTGANWHFFEEGKARLAVKEFKASGAVSVGYTGDALRQLEKLFAESNGSVPKAAPAVVASSAPPTPVATVTSAAVSPVSPTIVKPSTADLSSVEPEDLETLSPLEAIDFLLSRVQHLDRVHFEKRAMRPDLKSILPKYPPVVSAEIVRLFDMLEHVEDGQRVFLTRYNLTEEGIDACLQFALASGTWSSNGESKKKRAETHARNFSGLDDPELPGFLATCTPEDALGHLLRYAELLRGEFFLRRRFSEDFCPPLLKLKPVFADELVMVYDLMAAVPNGQKVFLETYRIDEEDVPFLRNPVLQESSRASTITEVPVDPPVQEPEPVIVAEVPIFTSVATVDAHDLSTEAIAFPSRQDGKPAPLKPIEKARPRLPLPSVDHIPEPERGPTLDLIRYIKNENEDALVELLDVVRRLEEKIDGIRNPSPADVEVALRYLPEDVVGKGETIQMDLAPEFSPDMTHVSLGLEDTSMSQPEVPTEPEQIQAGSLVEASDPRRESREQAVARLKEQLQLSDRTDRKSKRYTDSEKEAYTQAFDILVGRGDVTLTWIEGQLGIVSGNVAYWKKQKNKPATVAQPPIGTSDKAGEQEEVPDGAVHSIQQETWQAVAARLKEQHVFPSATGRAKRYLARTAQAVLQEYRKFAVRKDGSGGELLRALDVSNQSVYQWGKNVDRNAGDAPDPTPIPIQPAHPPVSQIPEEQPHEVFVEPVELPPAAEVVHEDELDDVSDPPIRSAARPRARFGLEPNIPDPANARAKSFFPSRRFSEERVTEPPVIQDDLQHERDSVEMPLFDDRRMAPPEKNDDTPVVLHPAEQQIQKRAPLDISSDDPAAMERQMNLQPPVRGSLLTDEQKATIVRIHEGYRKRKTGEHMRYLDRLEGITTGQIQLWSVRFPAPVVPVTFEEDPIPPRLSAPPAPRVPSEPIVVRKSFSFGAPLSKKFGRGPGRPSAKIHYDSSLEEGGSVMKPKRTRALKPGTESGVLVATTAADVMEKIRMNAAAPTLGEIEKWEFDCKDGRKRSQRIAILQKCLDCKGDKALLAVCFEKYGIDFPTAKTWRHYYGSKLKDEKFIVDDGIPSTSAGLTASDIFEDEDEEEEDWQIPDDERDDGPERVKYEDLDLSEQARWVKGFMSDTTTVCNFGPKLRKYLEIKPDDRTAAQENYINEYMSHYIYICNSRAKAKEHPVEDQVPRGSWREEPCIQHMLSFLDISPPATGQKLILNRSEKALLAAMYDALVANKTGQGAAFLLEWNGTPAQLSRWRSGEE